MWFLLYYSPKPWSQVWTLIYRKWPIAIATTITSAIAIAIAKTNNIIATLITLDINIFIAVTIVNAIAFAVVSVISFFWLSLWLLIALNVTLTGRSWIYWKAWKYGTHGPGSKHRNNSLHKEHKGCNIYGNKSGNPWQNISARYSFVAAVSSTNSKCCITHYTRSGLSQRSVTVVWFLVCNGHLYFLQNTKSYHTLMMFCHILTGRGGSIGKERVRRPPWSKGEKTGIHATLMNNQQINPR